MSTERRNYFVRDEFGVVWNDEPLPTFKQANEFKGYVHYRLNSPRTLTIFSRIRTEKVTPIPVQTRQARIESYMANGDF